jgi:hypothetical protein
MVREKPDKRSTWAPHGVDGWHVGPTLESCRCCTIWIEETRAIRACDTLSWLPTKVTMPLLSSNDLMLAGVQDILEALRNPWLRSPLDPLIDSHVTTLKILSELITGLLPVPKPLLATEPAPTPPLRVAAEPPLRVDPILIPATEEDLESPPQPHAAPEAPLQHNSHEILQDEAVPSPIPSPIPSPEPAPAPTVLENASPSQDPVTFHNSAVPKRRRKRTQTRREPVKNKSQPKPGNLPRPNVTAANLEAVPADWALHGDAFNPDTGEIAQHKERSKSSDEAHWRRGNSQEIGRLAQGLHRNPGPGLSNPF